MHTISKHTQQIPRTLDEYIQSLDPDIQNLLQFTSMSDDGDQLTKAIRNKSAIGVADCSVKVEKKPSAIAWIITDTTKSFVYEGQSGCPTFHDAIDSYSGEMFGIYVFLSAMKVIADFHNVHKGQITIACDNDSSLSMSLDSFQRVKSTDAYYDLIWAIQEIRSSLKFRIEAKIVAGHQEKKKRHLNIYERLNIEMDCKAKAFRKLIEKGHVQHKPTIVSQHNWSLRIGSVYVSYNMEQSIRDHIQGTELINYLIRNQSMTMQAIPHVDRNAIKGGTKLLPAGDKLWISKFVSGFCATASQMCLRDVKKKDEKQEDYDTDYTKWKNDQCPLCKIERENSAQVLHCTHKRAVHNRSRQIRDLSIWFDLQHTYPLLSSCIIHTLESSQDHTFYDSMSCLTSDEEYLQCALSQDAIGRVNFGFGRISKRWRNLQRAYLAREYSKTKFSADAWAKRLISKIYKMAQNLWRYRCARVHGSDTKKLSKRKRKALRK